MEYDNGQTGKKRKVLGTFAGTYVADFDFYNEAENYPLFLPYNKPVIPVFVVERMYPRPQTTADAGGEARVPL